MDKTWILKPRDSIEYKRRLNEFLDFAFANALSDNMIKCPCPQCGFQFMQTREDAYDHLLIKPFPPGYTLWLRHGEKPADERSTCTPILDKVTTEENPYLQMVQEAFNFTMPPGGEETTTWDPVEDDDLELPYLYNGRSREAQDFHDLLADGAEELYPGCSKYSKLSFLVKLYHIKCMCRVSDKAMSMILDLLRDAFEQAKLPSTFYEAKKTIRKLGIEYKKVDACPNDCMLYRGDDEDATKCKQCGTSRWKQKTRKGSVTKLKIPVRKNGKPLLAKTLQSDNNDGYLRHPRDAEAWKEFDAKYPCFSNDPRNVRLALASDGFNPFGNMSTKYSIWPVILIPYNLPPWLCMKQTSFILSMIIPGPKMPGNDIDVYLEPLVDELKQLWDGVETYDANKRTTFNMCAALMWTISDFPGLGNLSRWNTYSGLACPNCNVDAKPQRLTFSRKWCYMGHRRFLPQSHKYRLDRSRFDEQAESRNPPKKYSGTDILQQQCNMQVTFGKNSTLTAKRRRISEDADQDDSYWKKRSVFFELPYWKDHMLRHNLDVMHIEKNICDNVVFTILNDSVKSKDNLKARKDLQSMGIRPELWPDEGGKYPSAIFTMSNPQKDVFLKTLQNVIFPDGYSSNIARCVDIRQRKLYGLKSHDCHILIEQLLPILVKNALPSPVSNVIANLSSFFRELCGKAINPMQLGALQNHVVQTLCQMEMIFPPSFFTVMVHLTVHFVDELKLGGPVQYRWMYPIEKYLGRLKQYVRNRTQAEGSIAEGYLSEEILTFCSRYLDNTETRINRPMRVDDRPVEITNNAGCTMFPEIGKASGAVPMDSTVHSKEMKMLACGPMLQARRFGAYNVNGYKFRTIIKEDGLKTQNSGVYVSSNTRSYASMRDNRVAVGIVPYYGKIVDIIELNYSCHFTVVLFKCIWADTTTSRGIKEDHLGLTSVNFARPIHTGDREEDEPYILASEAQLVYYVRDEVEQEWSVVVHVKPRDLYDMGGENEDVEAAFSPQPGLNMSAAGDISDLQLTRNDDIEDPVADVSDNIDYLILNGVVTGEMKTEDFSSCCASTTFANKMALASPFSSLEHAITVARDIWSRKLNVRSWVEALSGRSCSNEYLETANEATVQMRFNNSHGVELEIASKEELKYIERAIRELLSKKSVQTTDEGDDDLDAISSGGNDISRDVELNRVPEEDNETLNIQHREDVVHAGKRGFDLNKLPWFGDELSDPRFGKTAAKRISTFSKTGHLAEVTEKPLQNDII
ncbi:uncharacterized protein LOC130965647 [Arachis stenosperma]|uniref:uncharacterized protein LOC130965647 n=1 Tax=Arachis stenosperma TaxID=217475 RepID=UPI0025AB6F0D|nr:uncharacterized protein LOC130965647 [Arachis stenosperma]